MRKRQDLDNRIRTVLSLEQAIADNSELIELGEMAADSLFTMLNGGEVHQLDRTIPVSLVVRESCGAQLLRPISSTSSTEPRALTRPLSALGEPHA